jgi:pyroglutamyl-peptidase
MSVLVTGFGAFPGVEHNPSEVLARAVDGAVVAGHHVYGRVVAVEYVRGPEEAIALARELGVAAVLGTGVAMRRSTPSWELRGAWWPEGAADVAGSTVTGLVGAREVRSTLAVNRPAVFGAEASEDAGGYVCNAWLYRVAQALDVPVGFLHLPGQGYPAHQLLTALTALLAGP